MAKSSVIVMSTVLVVDIIAFGLAVGAEQRRNTATIQADENDDYNHCVYDSDKASGYGAGAFVLLFLSHMVMMGLTKCLCCGRALRPGGSRAWAIVFFIFAWLAFIIAEICLLAGSVENAKHTKYRGLVDGDGFSCATLRKGVFGAGAAFVVFNLILKELYYISFSKAEEGGWSPYGRENAIGMTSL